ncbi:MAG: alanine racemase, partial [Candidatus Sumerlaeia bacterium]|nr:alanine racemase [Candidatus Sumerlaeia bacterium]
MSYGMLPDVRTRRTIDIKPVMTLLTRIINVREFPAGRYLSYGRTYQTKRRTRVGILPIGYGDGYPRHFSNCGYVIVRGKKAPVIGRVCMDQVLIDITRIPEAQLGDEVLVYGKKGKDHIPIEEVAHRIGTISYELTCRLTARVPRIYVNS